MDLFDNYYYDGGSDSSDLSDNYYGCEFDYYVDDWSNCNCYCNCYCNYSADNHGTADYYSDYIGSIDSIVNHYARTDCIDSSDCTDCTDCFDYTGYTDPDSRDSLDSQNSIDSFD